MATVNIFNSGFSQLGGSSILSVYDEDSVQTLTTPATSNVISSTSKVIRVAVTGGSVYLKFGVNPVANVNNSILLLDGSVEYFSVPAGYRVAAVNA